MSGLGIVELIIIAVCCIGILAAIAIVVTVVLLIQRGRNPEDSARVIDIEQEDLPG